MLNLFRTRLRKLLAANPGSSRRRKTYQARPVEALEDRICPANLNLLASGLMIYGAQNVDNNLTISYDGTEYTFTDTAETINAAGGLAAFATGSGTNSVTFNPNAVGFPTFNQVVMGGTGNGNDTLTVNSWRGGQEGLEIRTSANFDQVTINGSIGTSGNRVASAKVALNAAAITLSGDIFTSNLDISLGATGSNTAVSVTGNSEIDAGTATVEVNSGTGQVTGTGDLTIDGGSVQLRGNVNLSGAANISLNATNLLQAGSTGGLTSVTSGTGAIGLSGGTQVALSDAVSTGGVVTITSPTTTMSNSAGSITGGSIAVSGPLTNTTVNNTVLNATAGGVSVGGQLSSSTLVDVDATGNADFDGPVSATAIDVSAGTVNATSFQASAGNVSVVGPTTFDGVGDVLVSSTGSVTFSSSITGNTSNLNLQAPTLVDVDGAISSVAFLTVQGSGGTLASAQLTGATAQAITVDATVIGLSGNYGATEGSGGGVQLTGTVTVSGASVVVTSGGDTGENVLVTGSIDAAVADTTALTLDGGNFGNSEVTGAVGTGTRLQSLTVRGDTVTTQAVNVNTDLTARGGNIRLQGTVTGSGSGTATFAPAVAGRTLDFFNNPTHTRVGVNTRITTNTLSNIAVGAFGKFQFGDSATGIVRVHPNTDNSIATGAMNLTTDTEFEGGAIIVSEDIQQNANTLTFETDNLAIYRVAAGTGDVVINKLTAGGTLELRGNLAAKTTWGNNAITINALGATVNAPAAGAALPVLGLGTDQPQVNLGGPNASLTINADTLNALASSAVVSSGLLALNVDTLNLVGGVQTAGAGTVTMGNAGAAVNNVGGGPLSVLLRTGSDLSLANYDGNGGSLAIRGVGGELGTVTIASTTDTGLFSVGTSGGNDAATLNLGNIQAASIAARGNAINLNGIVDATAGNASLIGNVTLTGDSQLLNTSGSATSQVRVEGTIDGAFDLIVNAGNGGVVFTQTIGGGTALDNMTVTSGGISYLTVAITVSNDFSWTIGTVGNGINDRLIRVGAGQITAGNDITLEADVLQGITAGVDAVAGGTVTLVQRGNGD
ncbi:MAG: hypothetical protein RIK87_30025 [Fuerstiella sp.]